MQKCFLWRCMSLLLICCFQGFALKAQVNVVADLSQPVDFPLIKTKFGVYETPILDIKGKLNTMSALDSLGVQLLRYENGWGKNDIDFNGGQIKGTSGKLEYHREDYTRFLRAVVNSGSDLLISHSYTPDPLKPADDWRDRPSNLDVWEKINHDYAVYGRGLGFHRLYYEIWNEPDFFWFSTFDKETYFQLYKNGAKGVKSGDMDAKVGGPVTAFTNWHTDFIKFVEDNQLPLDFLSGHAYGNADGQVEAMRRALGTYERSEVDMLLTEFASYPTEPNTAYQPGGKVEQYGAAADFLSDVKNLLQHTDLTRVYWAQWTSEMGLLTYGGKKKALYNAFKIYNELPVDRKSVSVGQGIDALAAADAHRAGIVAWSTLEDREQALHIDLQNLPFATGTAELYRIDATHASYLENRNSENLTIVETYRIADHALSWDGTLPAKGTVYLKLFDDTHTAEPAERKVATVIQTKNWYYDRGNTHYAYFNPRTWYARLGMGSSKDEAQALVGAIVEDIPAKLQVNLITTGVLKVVNDRTALGVRVDYQQVDGQYRYSTFHHQGLASAEETFPWGTQTKPDTLFEVKDLGDFVVDVAANAPEKFRGRIILSFIMQNTGKNTSATVKVSQASEEVMPVQALVTAIENNPESYPLKLYPNPVEKTLKIDLATYHNPKLHLAVYDISGKMVLQRSWKTFYQEQLQLPVDHLKDGIYLMHVSNAKGQVHSKKFIKSTGN